MVTGVGGWEGGCTMSMMYNAVLVMSSVGIVVSYVTNDLCLRHVEVENIDFLTFKNICLLHS